jgi:hypothetical protein
LAALRTIASILDKTTKSGPPTEDDSAYRPASEFTDPDRFPTMKAIHKFLDENPGIRSRRPLGKNGKPISNRLQIHAGDWLKAAKKQPAGPLDQPAGVVDAVVEVEQAKANIRIGKEAGK